MFAQRDIRYGVRLESNGRWVAVNGQVLPEPPGEVDWLIEPSLNESGQVIGQSHNSANIYAWTGDRWRLVSREAVGHKATAMGYDGLLFWQELVQGIGPVLFAQTVGGLDEPERIENAEYQSGGIQDVRPEPPNFIVMWKGTNSTIIVQRRDGTRLLLSSACVRGDRVAAYADRGTTEGIGVVVYEFSTDTLWRVWHGDTKDFRVRLDDDGRTVAVSGLLENGFIEESQWTIEGAGTEPEPPDPGPPDIEEPPPGTDPGPGEPEPPEPPQSTPPPQGKPPMRVPNEEIRQYTKSIADICGDLFDNVKIYPDTGYTLAQQRASQCIGEWRAYSTTLGKGEFDGTPSQIRDCMRFYKANGGDDCLGEGKAMRMAYLPYAVFLKTGVVEPVVRLAIQGLNFVRPDGTIWKCNDTTAFRGPELYTKKEIGKLDDYYGWAKEDTAANTVRWFTIWQNTQYAPKSPADYDAIERALEHARDVHGLYVHLVGLCDQKPSNSVYRPFEEQKAHVQRLLDMAKRTGNVIFEISNEDTDSDSGNTAHLFPPEMFEGVWSTRSTWQGDQDPQAPGTWLDWSTYHLPTGDDFACKGKVLYEIQRQGLGEYPAPRIPAIGGESRRIAEGTNPRQHADQAMVCELFGVGYCLHGGFSSQWPGQDSDMQACSIPTGPALECAKAVGVTRRAGLIDPRCAAEGRYVRGQADGGGECPIVHRDKTDDPQRGAVRSYFMEWNGHMFGGAVDPGPQWKLEPREGWRVVQQGGYDVAPFGPNVIVLAR